MKEIYSVVLDDYSSPAFVSGTKNYYGTLKQISAFMETLRKHHNERLGYIVDSFEEYKNGNKNATVYVAYNHHKMIERYKVLGEKRAKAENYQWEHFNTYDFIYEMRCDKVKTVHRWIKRRNQYIRVLKAQFTNLQYRSSINDEWCNYNSCWGFPCIIMNEGNTLMVAEKGFNSLEEAQADMASFSSINDVIFTEFCNDIFGDG